MFHTSGIASNEQYQWIDHDDDVVQTNKNGNPEVLQCQGVEADGTRCTRVFPIEDQQHQDPGVQVTVIGDRPRRCYRHLHQDPKLCVYGQMTVGKIKMTNFRKTPLILRKRRSKTTLNKVSSKCGICCGSFSMSILLLTAGILYHQIALCLGGTLVLFLSLICSVSICIDLSAPTVLFQSIQATIGDIIRSTVSSPASEYQGVPPVVVAPVAV